VVGLHRAAQGAVRRGLTRPRSIDNAPQLETITPRIATVRGQRVVIDADLAALYGVPTKRFNEAVKRNLAKFPTDFMFVLAAAEAAAFEVAICDLKRREQPTRRTPLCATRVHRTRRADGRDHPQQPTRS
jgi:ORF6N domain